MCRARRRPARARHGGHRHRGGQPPPLSGQALPRPGRRPTEGGPTWSIRSRCPRSLRARAALSRIPRIVKVLHAADNDLGLSQAPLRLHRRLDLRHGASPRASSGVTALGLDGLLAQFLDVDPGKSRQKDDWSRRPLTAEQETYALNDVVHLIPLRDRLIEELAAKGRLALGRGGVRGARRPEPAREGRRSRRLPQAQGRQGPRPARLGRAARAPSEREAIALALDRPPFMILGQRDARRARRQAAATWRTCSRCPAARRSSCAASARPSSTPSRGGQPCPRRPARAPARASARVLRGRAAAHRGAPGVARQGGAATSGSTPACSSPSGSSTGWPPSRPRRRRARARRGRAPLARRALRQRPPARPRRLLKKADLRRHGALGRRAT